MASINETRIKPEQTRKPLIIKGKNASGQIIEAYIPAGILPRKDPGLAIAESLKKFPDIRPTSLRKPK